MEGCASKRMVVHDWREDLLEKEEELCKALSNFSITLSNFKMNQLTKSPKLQVREEKNPKMLFVCTF